MSQGKQSYAGSWLRVRKVAGSVRTRPQVIDRVVTADDHADALPDRILVVRYAVPIVIMTSSCFGVFVEALERVPDHLLSLLVPL